jgi:hypothetical protein
VEPLKLEPLAGAALPKAVAAAVSGPGPAKLMVVRGMAPLRPVEMLIALYQLSFDTDAAVKSAAEAAPGTLPDKVMLAPLGEPLPAPVLHFFAERLPSARRQAIEKVLPSGSTKRPSSSSSRMKCVCSAARPWSKRCTSTRMRGCLR